MKITFLPENKIWEGDPGRNLMVIAGEVGISINGNCAGEGTCAKCKVYINNGELLACKTFPKEDMTVVVPSGKRVETRKEDLNKLPDTFIPDESGGSYFEDALGISFDIGTTTVVGNLWYLKNNKNLGAYAMTNPQGIYGGDVISRITYSNESEQNLETLNSQIINCLNQISHKLIKKNNLSIDNVMKVVVVANTTMSHILVKESPASLAFAPFKPVFEGSVRRKISSLGLEGNKDGEFYLVSGIAGHVGSDITSGIIAAGLDKKQGLILYIDVGTNGEIVISQNGRMMACSTAAGPAFEGASIEHGMRAAEGAIEQVEIQEDVTYKTIGGEAPVGICGSGIMDAIAQMVDSQLINKTGKLLSKEEYLKECSSTQLGNRLVGDKKSKAFVLTKDDDNTEITISQKDIREVQLAKAAISSGIKMMLDRWGLTMDDIDEIIIAGAFGSHIDEESAKTIGVIPKIESEKIHFLGNTAGIGASMILLSKKEEELSNSIVKDIMHLDLASCEDFQNIYLKEMSF